MNTGVATAPPAVTYPERDGNPMSDNTLQFRWIVTLQGGLDDLFADRPDVFVAGDLLWYPVEGDNATRQAPDVMVAFGRPKGDRGSYRQWDEGGVAPQVVFEVLSPGNRPGEMARKLLFYETYGVEEYYVYDPDRVRLAAYTRGPDGFEQVANPDGFTSPRLGVRFDLSSGPELVVHRPDGRRFLTYRELAARAEEQARRAEEQAARAEGQARRADAAEAELARLRDRLRAAGLDPDATP